MVLKTSREGSDCPARRRSVLAVFLSGLLVVCLPVVVQGQEARIAIVLTPHDTYRASATTLDKSLSEKGLKTQIFELPKESSKLVQTRPPGAPASAPADPGVVEVFRQVSELKPAAIVSIGETATVLSAENMRKTPIIYCTVTNALDMPVNAKGDPRAAFVAGVTMDVSPKEQIQWVKRVQPQASSLGVLCSEHSAKTAEAVRLAGESAGIRVTVFKTSKEEFVKAVEALSGKGCDGVLMLADARIYDATTSRHLLLWGVRNKKSVWAFSENFVKAGALGASYADAEQMLKQTVEIVGKIVSGTKPTAIGMQYPSEVLRAINERTAGVVGLNVPREALGAADARHGGSE